LENNQDNKDYKNLLKWDADNAMDEKKEDDSRKKSKKVLKREAKEQQKQRTIEIIKERRKSRITKKGRVLIIAGAAVAVVALAAWILFGYFGIWLDLTRTLARAGDTRVSTAELNEYMQFLKNQNPESVPPEGDEQYTVLQQNILDSIIVLKVLKSYSEKNNITVNNEDIEAEYVKIIANYPSEEDFNNDLKAKKINRSFLDEQLKNQIIRDRVFNKVTKDVTVTDEEILNYYNDNLDELFTVPEQVRVSHILIKFNIPEGSELNDAIKKEAKDKISEVQKQLSDGGDFAELAKKYSEDTASAPNGGDIGFISAGQTVPEFEEAAFALETGKYSEIVETYYGYHLITVTERNEAYVKSFDEVEETIKTYLLSNKQMEKWQEFITELMESIEIEYKTALKGQLTNIPGTAADTAQNEMSE
jgi:parvulin-like peptidyl-prolyl isomerase